MINIEDVSNYTSLHIQWPGHAIESLMAKIKEGTEFSGSFSKNILKDLGKMRAWEKMNKLVARQKLSSNVGRK